MRLRRLNNGFFLEYHPDLEHLCDLGVEVCLEEGRIRKKHSMSELLRRVMYAKYMNDESLQALFQTFQHYYDSEMSIIITDYIQTMHK